MPSQSPFQGAVKVDGIVEGRIEGRQVKPGRRNHRPPRFEVAVIQVHVGTRGAWVQHHRWCRWRNKRLPFASGRWLRIAGGQPVPLHLGRNLTPPLLEDAAGPFITLGAATASLRPLPALLLKAAFTIEASGRRKCLFGRPISSCLALAGIRAREPERRSDLPEPWLVQSGCSGTRAEAPNGGTGIPCSTFPAMPYPLTTFRELLSWARTRS